MIILDTNVLSEVLRPAADLAVLRWFASAADAYARITEKRKLLGSPISQFDAQIAAITLASDGILVTRNVGDFKYCGIEAPTPGSHSTPRRHVRPASA